MSKSNRMGVLFGAAPVLIGSQLAIGAAAVFAKLALIGAGAVMVAALRLTIASAVLFAISARSKQKQQVPRAHEYLFLFCGLALAVHFATWIASLSMTSVAIATLLVSTAPVWTTLYDLVFLRRRPLKQFWIGFVATISGAIIAVTSGASQALTNTQAEQNLGALLATVGGFAFACYLIVVRNVSDGYSTLVIVNRTYAWAAAFLWLGVLIFQEKLPSADPNCWIGIFGMAIFSQLLGHTGMNLSLKSFSPNVVALSTLLEPVFAAVLALIVFHEALSREMIVGALLIVAGLMAVMSAKVVEPEDRSSPIPEL